MFIARKIRFLAPDELQVFMEKFSNDGDENSVSESHESGEEEEEENEKKIVDTNDPNSKSSEEVNLDEDSEAILPPLINIHHKQIPEDNEED